MVQFRNESSHRQRGWQRMRADEKKNKEDRNGRQIKEGKQQMNVYDELYILNER